MTVANTILAQLGGNRFLAMTGAKNLLDGGNHLQFDLPRGFSTNKATKCRVTLTDCDTYRVAFYKWNARKLEAVLVGEDDGVYAEDLRRIFTDRTGLDCTMGHMKAKRVA